MRTREELLAEIGKYGLGDAQYKAAQAELVSCLVRFCSNADGSLSAFLSRNAAFRQTKAFAFAPDICETRH